MNLSDSIKRGLLVALVLLTGSSFAGKPVVEEGPRGGLVETKEERGARMGWWREARFGMFIHWGLYAVHGGEWKGRQYRGWSEWVVQGIPVADYETLVPRFNPVQFNAEEWAKLAKDAGMKYIVITTKHHEGFCLWDTKLTTFSVMSTPFKRDIMKELAAACQKEGIRLGWYYSVMDWHHPEYIPRREVDKRPAEKDCYPRYVNYMKGQLKELLANYGPISVVWFDGDWEHSAGENNSKEIGELIYGLQPGALINNRINMAMDFDTPEQKIPEKDVPKRDWETCMTITSSWGYNKSLRNWKPTSVLLRNLADTASKGGNYLLNVGPTGEGIITPQDTERLREVGAWLKVNGEAIYGTQASPFRSSAATPWGRCTRKSLPGGGTRLYLHVFEWPEGKRLEVAELCNPADKAYLLTDKAGQLKMESNGKNGQVVLLPATQPDPINTVVVLEYAGEPVTHHPPVFETSAAILYDSMDVAISSPARGAEIRYTSDGSEPSATSPKVTGPIHLTQTTTIKARSFYKGQPILETVQATFTKTSPAPAAKAAGLKQGLRYEYFEGTWKQASEMTALKPVSTGVVPTFDISSHKVPDKFGFRFTGYVEVPKDGVYAFELTSDDGSQMLIGDKLVVDNDGPHSMKEATGAAALAKGLHPITVLFFDSGGSSGLKVRWSESGGALRPIEPGVLHYQTAQ